MQRLGKNIDSYKGETIDIDQVLAEVEAAAGRTGWLVQRLSVAERHELLALQRDSGQPRKDIYISTGIHGDEPAGPAAVAELLRAGDWPEGIRIWLCPCLNPEGFRRNTRENEEGIDLNRDYRHLRSAAVRAHVEWLASLPRFHLCLCLHEDWESHGFYLYELNPDARPSLAEPIVEAVSKVCPIDPSAIIEEREAQGGIIRPSLDPASRPQWPEAFYLIQHKTRMSYTLETPSDFPLNTRVAALTTAVRAVLNCVTSDE